MKKKLVAAMLALTLTLTGCGAAPSNVAENTEAPATTEVVAATELETEILADAVVIAPVENETEAATKEVAEETESTEAESEFTVTAMEATKYAKKSVNVRKGPSTEYEKVGSLSTNQKVKVIGQADTGWYQIEFGDEVAYVSDNYLVDEKVAVNTTPGTNEAGNAASESTGSENVTTTPTASTPSTPVEDNNVTEDDGWGDLTYVGEGGGLGTGTPTTDGYGPGVEIEISPAP